MQNFGVIEGKRDTDFVAGTLPYEERNPSGDWTSYLPPGEWQKGTVDTMACVTFSALNSIETQHKFLTGQERNFSDRFTARLSGTTPDGNYLWRVADCIRKDGLVDESDWPAPENFTWETYYQAPPIEVINKARLFLNEWVVQYEWIDFTKESLIKHLKHAPIQVVLPGHAVLGFFRNEDVLKYFDSYVPFIKERTELVSSALKIVLTRKGMTEQTVKNLYLAAFNRLPDSEELAYWEGKDASLFARTVVKERAKFLTENANL